jgi:hypothetical protein
VSRPALNLMEDILTTNYKCTLPSGTPELHVSEHVYMGIFFLVMCNSCLNFLRTFSVTSYINNYLFTKEHASGVRSAVITSNADHKSPGFRNLL